MNTRVYKFQNKVLRNLGANRAEGKECLRKLLNEKLSDTFRQIYIYICIFFFFRGSAVVLSLLIVEGLEIALSQTLHNL
jgi:hypothetical protein